MNNSTFNSDYDVYDDDFISESSSDDDDNQNTIYKSTSINNNFKLIKENGNENDLCSICFDKFNLPIKIPCDHMFCFLCFKELCYNLHSKICPLCRKHIPTTIINDIKFNKFNNKFNKNQLYTSSVYWMYNTKNGNNKWWLFDSNSNKEIEKKYSEFLKDEKIMCKLSICGFEFQLDYKNLVQINSMTHDTRSIKRLTDLNTLQSDKIVGISGIPFG
jgi:E3 ubiquitin-protein ligase RNF146